VLELNTFCPGMQMHSQQTDCYPCQGDTASRPTASRQIATLAKGTHSHTASRQIVPPGKVTQQPCLASSWRWCETHTLPQLAIAKDTIMPSALTDGSSVFNSALAKSWLIPGMHWSIPTSSAHAMAFLPCAHRTEERV
jgi:hypothetical protein